MDYIKKQSSHNATIIDVFYYPKEGYKYEKQWYYE